MATNILVKVLGHMDTQLIISFSSSMQYGFSPFSISIMQKYNLLKVLNVTDNILWVLKGFSQYSMSEVIYFGPASFFNGLISMGT